MEGLVGVQYISGTRGAITVELSFRDPPDAVIDVLQYAMLNQLTIDIPAGVISGSLSPFSVVPVNMDIQNDIQEAEMDFGRVKLIVDRHRYVRVNARVP